MRPFVNRPCLAYGHLVLGLLLVALPARSVLSAAHHKARLAHAKTQTSARQDTQAAHGPTGTVSPTPSPAQKIDATQAVEAVEVVETVEAVEPVEAAQVTPASDHASATSGAPKALAPSLSERAAILLGHMHAAVVHLPIAWVLLWVLFDVGGLWLKQTQLLVCGPYLGALATLSFAPAVISGLLRFDELAHAAADAHTMDPALVHRNLMWVGLVMCAATWLVRRKTVGAQALALRIGYTALLAACMAIVAYSAHLGGALVYGEEFFTL